MANNQDNSAQDNSIIELNSLTEKQTANNLDNLLLFDESTNSGTRMKFKKLASNILENYSESLFGGIAQSIQQAVNSIANVLFGSGRTGQVLSKSANGGFQWNDPGTPTDEQVTTIVDEFLTEHPEYTTTVVDGSITTVKFANGVIDNTLSVQGSAADAKATGDTIKDIVKVSTTQPQSSATKIWINDSAEGIEIPTMDEFDGLSDEVDSLSNILNNILDYVDYSDIKSFTASPSAVEIGNASASVTLAWEFNGVPESVTLNGVSKDVSSTGETVTAQDNGTTHSVQYTLTTPRGSKYAAFSFLPKIYYGIAVMHNTDLAGLIRSLSNNELSTNGKKTFSVNVLPSNYIWFASPARYGARAFKVGGFDGGFEPYQTVSVTNASGYTENYYLYRSTNSGLGSTTVAVS